MADYLNYHLKPPGHLIRDAIAETLTGARALTLADPLELHLDPGGATRVVTLPAEADCEGSVYRIFNTADAAESLTINDDGGSTIVTLARQRGVTLKCESAAWAQVGELYTMATS